ncbi:hypothetical protein BJ508DRAFT_361550 [Ascobolus immersus RN42]|uniref:Uncharacterized protein n=1 Tax=Ascobolus immersus RN42 TaxID=1160509 RepID=A0A3N4I767_ASCIM|nr:hypothetical protein BJ508DRAFT_361550 [Ascobolus immersus RN42]
MLFSRSLTRSLRSLPLHRLSLAASRTYITLCTTTNPQSPLPVLPNAPASTPPKSIIFLATPQFSTLLPSIHQSLTTVGIPPTTSFLAAIVDAIPTSTHGTTSRYGYTWLLTSHPLEITPSPLPHTLELLDPSSPQTLSFSLANTIFTTGNFSESYYSHTPITPDEITGWSVVLPAALTAKSRTHLPLIPLTQPRKITASAGNILRQLNSEPASAELEVAVHAYLKAHPNAPKPEIFARIATNEEILSDGADLGKKYDIFNPKHGAVRRVLSGGGGWGQKSGLLAIDPQQDSDVERYARDFEEGFLGLKDPSGNSGIVGKGKWVRFYLVGEPEATPVEKEVEKAEEEVLEGEVRLGCVDKEEDAFTGTVPMGVKEEVLEGVWGAGSESGVLVTGMGSGKSRRLDVPGGWVGLGGKKPVKL